MKPNFVLYRHPDQQHCTLMESDEVRVLHDMLELDDAQGYVMAPFVCSDSSPMVLLSPDRTERFSQDDVLERTAHLAQFSVPDEHSEGMVPAAERAGYAHSFGLFHDALEKKLLKKIVLSRRQRVEWDGSCGIFALFQRACLLYPHQFVSLFSSGVTGTWLMATPEILVSSDTQHVWHTMALAGTMTTPGPWSEKDRCEQQVVADYIASRLAAITQTCEVGEPVTAMAARLYHLRTDFQFTLRDNVSLGTLVSQLHPTPAVCGFPQAMAQRLILSGERHQRRYYSGFSGPLHVDGLTRFYVSLRCMQIYSDTCVLYAGGGLLRESCEENEWQETESKLKTMKYVLG